MKSNYLKSIILLAILSGCDFSMQPTPSAPARKTLPPATQQGLNTIGYVVNDDTISSDFIGPVYIYNNRYVQFTHSVFIAGPPLTTDINFTVYLLDDPLNLKTYQLNDSSLKSELRRYVSCYYDENCHASLDERFNGKAYIQFNDAKTFCTYYTDSI